MKSSWAIAIEPFEKMSSKKDINLQPRFKQCTLLDNTRWHCQQPCHVVFRFPRICSQRSMPTASLPASLPTKKFNLSNVGSLSAFQQSFECVGTMSFLLSDNTNNLSGGCLGNGLRGKRDGNSSHG